MSAGARRWVAVAGVLALATLAQAGGLVPHLRYDRAAIGDGEIWRLVTGHLVHLGGMHLALNAAGLVLVNALVGPRLPVGAWAAAFLASALAAGAGLWLLVPALDWYVGLSGVLHGLLAAGAAAGIAVARERLFAVTLLGVLAAKLAWEQLAGPMPGTAAAAGGPVIVDAHLFGAAGGLLVGAAALLHKRDPADPT